MKGINKNITSNLNILKDDKNSYHSSVTSKISEKEENKILPKKMKKEKTSKILKAEIINKSFKEKGDIDNNIIKPNNNNINVNNKKQFNISRNKKKENKNGKKKEIKIKEDKENKKKDKVIINKNLLKEQNPIVIDELPKQKHTCFLGNRSLKSIYKLIEIYIFHREEIFLIKINNGLTVNELIEQILQKIKIIKEELELFLFYEIFDINIHLSSDRNLHYLFQNISFKNLDKGNKIKKSIINLKYLNNNINNANINNNSNSSNDTKQKILIFPDIDNKYKNMKIIELLKNKTNYYVKANQVSKNKYNSDYYYRNEIKNLDINSFISNINKEIEKNNLLLSKNNNKTVDIEKNYKENGLGIKCKYKNIVIVEGIDLITDFLHEIETFLNENEIKENYNYQNIGKGKYSFGFQRKDNAYDFHKFVNLLQLVNKKYFGIRCRLKIFNIKNLKYNSSYKNNFIKNKFYFKDKFNNNNYFALQNNLCGPFNSYFLNKGQKKFVTNDDTESMNEIVKLNYYKFKNNEMNYINSENISTIPLI